MNYAMGESIHTKVCPACAETIKAAARKCPFCQSNQSLWGNWRGELAAATRAHAVRKLKGELRYWLEMCPCTGEACRGLKMEGANTALAAE
jgi:hypothetical protein